MPGFLAKQSGSVITVSSMWGQVGASCEAAYSATKGAVIALTKALAKELGPSGIRVNCVAPGVILTDMCAMWSRKSWRKWPRRPRWAATAPPWMWPGPCSIWQKQNLSPGRCSLSTAAM